MSIQNFVFLRDKQLLSGANLESALNQHELALSLPDSFDLTSETLLRVDAEFETLPCVFDYALADYQHKDWSWSDEDEARFDGCEAVAMFNCFSNAQEIMALMITSCVLAKQARGLLYAPVFHDGLLASHEALDLLFKHFDDIKSQFNGVSKLR
ncbi:hypothetical protein [Marinicella rhabdoformis]|uniref:hypothetical protein n=1 Tax=Marinicella rhabdoformis TaxID=2580566 RepID=UPI0012AEC6EE|nr:hypothetical protein [Marinicella rhabdoformis]